MSKFKFNDDKYTKYTIHTNLDVTGLSSSTSVRYKGIVIGNIEQIGLDESNFNDIKMVLSIKKSIPIRIGSSVILQSQGIAGLSYLALRQNEKEPFIEDPKDRILRFETSLLGKLSSKADHATDEILEILKNFRVLFDENNLENISQIIQNINNLGQNLNQTQANINVLIKDTNNLMLEINARLKNGDYNVKEALTPLIIKLNSSLNHMDAFFSKGNNLIDKFDKNPYNTIFGVKK